MEKKSFYITTTLPYVNAKLHLGHALEFVRADVVARYKKLEGFDVFLNTGTDEHGMKIYEKAQSVGLSPQEFVDKRFEDFKESVKIFGMDEEVLHFIRTTDQNHIKAAQEFWQRCDKNGFIYKKNYESKYCVGCECEKTDSELTDGECTLHPGMEIKIINEENYFFKYSSFGEKLLQLYEKNPNFVVPDFRLNEMKNFIEAGLQDFSISRLKEKMPWGIPVPGDENQVMYVWFDALVNYISTLGWPFAGAKDLRPEENLFEKYWVHGTPTQYCGKDNTRFQAAMWQAMLMAAQVPNSHQIVVNGFITGEGGIRMSKTLGNVVDPVDIVKEYGTDALRYFLLREISSFEDSPFTPERFKEAYNSGLANGLGNLTSRVMKMATTNNVLFNKDFIEKNHDVFVQEYNQAINSFNLTKAMESIWEIVSWADRSIQSNQPFKKIKIDREAGEMDIKFLLWDLHLISDLLKPFLPETAEKIQACVLKNKMPEQPLFLRKE